MGHSAATPAAPATPAPTDGTHLVRALSDHLGLPLAPHTFTLTDGVRVGVDGADGEPPRILVQCSPLQGRLRSSHRNKLIADAFTLSWLRDAHFPEAHTLLALSSGFSSLLSDGAWLPAALDHCRVSVALVPEAGVPQVLRTAK